MDRGAWQAVVHGLVEDLDMTEQLSNNKNTKNCFLSFSGKRCTTAYTNFYLTLGLLGKGKEYLMQVIL